MGIGIGNTYSDKMHAIPPEIYRTKIDFLMIISYSQFRILIFKISFFLSLIKKLRLFIIFCIHVTEIL